MLAKTVFKSRADEMVPKVVSYTTEQILTAMFGKNVQIFIYFCGKMLWFRTKYLGMKKGHLLSNLSLSRCFDAAAVTQLNVFNYPLRKKISSFPDRLVLTLDEIAELFTIFQQGPMTKASVIANANSLLPGVSIYTFDQLILAMFGNHIGKYLVTTENEVRLRRRKHYRMEKSTIVSSLQSALGLPKTKKRRNQN